MKRRARKRRNIDRGTWMARVWKWYRRNRICEYLCDDCAKPYVEKPKAIESEQLYSGSSVATVFVEQVRGRTNYYIEFGCSKVMQHKLRISSLLEPQHLDDVVKVAEMAGNYIKADMQRQGGDSRRRRRQGQ